MGLVRPLHTRALALLLRKFLYKAAFITHSWSSAYAVIYCFCVLTVVPRQTMFRLWEGDAGSVRASPWYGVSLELLQVHGESCVCA